MDCLTVNKLAVSIKKPILGNHGKQTYESRMIQAVPNMAAPFKKNVRLFTKYQTLISHL